jgi:ectoine hydroxylase-related dioxygenase (phytanoyl-CoA dioxygenase family)
MTKLNCPEFKLECELTQEQIDFYDQHGVVVFRNFLSAMQVELCLSEAHRVEKLWLDEGREKVNGIPLKFGADEYGNKMIQRACFLSLFSEPLHDILEDKRLMALLVLMKPFLGRISETEKDGLVFNHFIRSHNSAFTQMGWHTDSPRDIFLGQLIKPMLNVGIHLDDCPMENGGLRVIAGSHKQGTLKMLFAKKYFVDNDPDPREVGFDIHRGDLTVHNGRIWHRVQQSPNFGEKSRRRVMYIPIITGKYQPRAENSKTPLYHLFSKKILK